jgi:hypothetical protein
VATVSVAAAVDAETTEEKAAIKQWAQVTAKMLSDAADYLGRKSMPPVYLVHRRDYEKKQLEWENTDSRQGVLLRLNLLERKAVQPGIQEQILEHTLHAAHHFRIQLKGDERGWVLAGFAHWWPRRESYEPPTVWKKKRPGEAELKQWLKLVEAEPERLARRLGAIAVDLIGKRGAAQQQAFLSSILGKHVPHNSLAGLSDWWSSLPSMMRKHLGTEPDAFYSEWSAAIHGMEEEKKP